jgi:phage tail sheath protein FI
MPVYQTPGVYFEPVDAVLPAVTALRTDIASFVGIAQCGPLHEAVPVRSWRQFQTIFGNFIPGGYLAYSVKAFFENGGRKCYVVRVADRDAANSASAIIHDRAGNPAWIFQASSPGVWGNLLAVRLQTVHRAQTRTVVEAGGLDQKSSRVENSALLEIGTLVRLSQPGTPDALRVVTDLEPATGRLVWELALPPAFSLNAPILVQSIEYTLTVFAQGRLVAIYENLSLVLENPHYAPGRVGFPPVTRRDTRDDLFPQPPPFVIVCAKLSPDKNFGSPSTPDELAVDSTEPVFLTLGSDGLSTLSVDDFIGEAADPLEGYEEQQLRRRGLRALEIVEEVAVVAVPDILIRPELPLQTAPLPPCYHDPCLGDLLPEATRAPRVTAEQPPVFSDGEIFQVQSALISHCEDLANRFALLDPPFDAVQEDALGLSAILAWRSRFDSKYAALHYPWVRVPDPLASAGQVMREVPACGHVAGLIARTDLAVGVHKAPANSEILWVLDPTAMVDETIQGDLNPRGINAIRCFPGRGIRVYGARTVSNDPDWRFINVRRLMLMIESALTLSSQWVVFEPNNAYTRSKLKLAITSFLETLWRKGALAGAHPEEAFYVDCDEDNNPPDERDLGHLHADIGVAPSQPAEFVVLRLGKTSGELEITEL